MELMNRLPSYEDYKTVLEEGLELVKEERKNETLGRKGGVHLLENTSFKYVIIIGDVHGDFRSLSKIFEESIIKLMNRKENYLFVALGDYIDRGPAKEQVLVLFHLLRLKIEEPQKVILLRGNHEPPKGLEPYPHDYPHVLTEIYGYEKGRELYNLSRRLFDELPYAVIIRDIALLLHGGPPTKNLDRPEELYLGYNEWPPNIYLLEEILWNDPRDDIELWAPSPRGAGRLWGLKITEKVIDKLKVKYIIRGHEPAPYGYKVNHKGKVITLFSRLGEPYFNIKASYIFCDSIERLKKKPLECIRSFS